MPALLLLALWIMFNLCSVQFHLFTLYESDIFQSGEKFQLCCQFFLQQIWTYIYSIYIHIFIYKMENLPFSPPSKIEY